MLEDTRTLVVGESKRAMLDYTSILVLGERLEGYIRGHQHPSVRREPRGLC